MNNKPKGKTPSLIGSANGRPQRVHARRKSHCYRCGSVIQVGEDCFGIPKIGSGFSNIKRYCKSCFGNILTQTRVDLDELNKL